jgi:hypothetical protein
MREPGVKQPVFGMMAEFDRPERLIEAVRQAREARFRAIDAYSPFPIEELTEILNLRDRRVPILTAIGAILGAASGFGIQVYANLAFPIDIGSRPLVAIPAFLLITFELGVLGAVLFAIFGMLVLNRLPRLHHPVFDVETFDLASMDKFFLIIFSSDRRFDPEATRDFLMRLKPRRVDLLSQPVVER